MRGGFEREVVSSGRQWGRAGVLGTLRPLSLIKAWRCRPTGEVWPHLALIRLRRPAVGSVLAHRPSETGALPAALPPHLVAQRWPSRALGPRGAQWHPAPSSQQPCLSGHCPLAQPLRPRRSFPQEDPSTPSASSPVPSAASLLTPLKSAALGGLNHGSHVAWAQVPTPSCAILVSGTRHPVSFPATPPRGSGASSPLATPRTLPKPGWASGLWGPPHAAPCAVWVPWG